MQPVIGHAEACRLFHENWRSGRLHHAWLLAGPEGVGKRAFADAAAAMVLAGAPDFVVPEDHQAARLIAAGSHPDLVVIERPLRKDGREGQEIVVCQIRGGKPESNSTLEPIFYRGIPSLIQSSSALGGWRVVIIDAADDLNPAAANAFLKNLEEPPAQTVFLLVSHAPGRLLPTIRSRCRTLRFGLLNSADTRAVLERILPQAPPDELADLVALAEGAPGRAAAYAGLSIGELAATLDQLAAATPAQARAIALRLARSLSGKAAQPRFEAFLDLAPRALAARARTAHGPALARLLHSWESAKELGAGAVALALEPGAVTMELSRLVAQTHVE